MARSFRTCAAAGVQWGGSGWDLVSCNSERREDLVRWQLCPNARKRDKQSEHMAANDRHAERLVMTMMMVMRNRKMKLILVMTNLETEISGDNDDDEVDDDSDNGGGGDDDDDDDDDDDKDVAIKT